MFVLFSWFFFGGFERVFLVYFLFCFILVFITDVVAL